MRFPYFNYSDGYEVRCCCKPCSILFYKDITDTQSIDALIADTVDKFGKLDVLVNNAANVALKDGRVDELTVEMWDAIFQSDLRGTFYTTKCALPYLQKNETGGSIINLTRFCITIQKTLG